DAAEIGLYGDALWSLSNVELQAQFKGARQRADGWYELGLYIAWHIAYWSRIKTMPSWESVKAKRTKATASALKTKEPEAPQNWQQMKGIMAAHRIALASTAGKPKQKPAK